MPLLWLLPSLVARGDAPLPSGAAAFAAEDMDGAGDWCTKTGAVTRADCGTDVGGMASRRVKKGWAWMEDTKGRLLGSDWSIMQMRSLAASLSTTCQHERAGTRRKHEGQQQASQARGGVRRRGER